MELSLISLLYASDLDQAPTPQPPGILHFTHVSVLP
jgi:hypothetical protein